MAFSQPIPTYADFVIEDAKTGKPTINPIWAKWLSDLAKSLQTTTEKTVDVNGVSGTMLTTAGDTLVFTNGVLTSFTPGPPLP